MPNPQKVANCCVLGDGSNSQDHAHVSKITPMQTKKKEIENDPQYQSDAMSPKREKAVTKARREDARPLDGGVAKR